MSLLLFFSLYFGLTFAWRSTVVYRKTGVNPLVLPLRDDAFGFVGFAFKTLIGGIAVYVLLITLEPTIADQLGTIHALKQEVTSSIGWVLMWISLFWLVAAQSQMGDSWRVGIDEDRKTTLITTGLFSISRNPIFLGMRISVLGLFLVSPTSLTLAILVAAELLIQIQVRLEESHLLVMNGAEYKQYMARVRRWL